MNINKKFDQDKHLVSKDIYFLNLIKELECVQQFLEDFNFLIFGRDSIITKKIKLISPLVILDSAIRTLQSIRICCEYGNIADANTLLRKYRDDLFFYLYIVSVGVNYDWLKADNEINKHEANIGSWINNSLNNLHISEMLKYIARTPKTNEAVKKYNLQKSFDRIGKELNNFVHANGISYYNIPYQKFGFDGFVTAESVTENLIHNIKYFTVTFIFLITMTKQVFVMSDDYIDYLDCNMTPPDGCQYWVAPFIIDFFNSNKTLIDKDCIDYLKELTGMELS